MEVPKEVEVSEAVEAHLPVPEIVQQIMAVPIPETMQVTVVLMQETMQTTVAPMPRTMQTTAV